MKIIVITLLVLCVLYMNVYINKINEIERNIYELYENDFREYLIFDDEGNLKYDIGKLKIYFENKGFVFDSNNNDLSFVISFHMLVKYQRQYDFYLVRNDEI